MKYALRIPHSAFDRVKVGPVSVPIYRGQVRVKGRIYSTFTVSLTINGQRRRWTRATLEAARAIAREKAALLAEGRAHLLAFTPADAASYQRARQLLLFTSQPLETAAAEYAQADELLAPLRMRGQRITVPQAVADYVARHPASVARKTVAEISAEMLAAKRQDGLSAVWLRALTQGTRRFCAAFTGPLADVQCADLEAWFRALPGGPRTRNNLRIVLRTLASFARKRGYLPKDWAEMDALTVSKETAAPVEIFTPAEFRALLEAAPARLLPYFALGGLAGLRTAEIQRLDWRAFKWTAGHLVVEAEQAKTAARRLVPLNDSLRSWLAPLRQDAGPLLRNANVGSVINLWIKQTNPARLAAGQPPLVWRRNALRHSYISYRVAELKDVAAVALEAGNSPTIIFQHYRELVTAAEAQAWFAIHAPEPSQKRVLNFPASP